MMNLNLFSIFDSSTSMLYSLNWLSSSLLLFFVPLSYWLIPSRFNYFNLLLLNKLVLEFKMLLSLKMNNLNMIMFISLFYMIMLNNFLGLFLYIFTSSSHLVFSLSFSLVLWMGMMLFGWINNMDHMFVHLLPQGTPNVLMLFMILIESISNLIRPGTLAVRLSANMIAGHLLITLISNNGSDMFIFMLVILLLMQNLLMILELAVSIIQGYVFTVLSSLYSTEVL